MDKRFRFGIDRGGTFCDVYCEVFVNGNYSHHKLLKLLSVDPVHYPDAPREGIRRILEQETGRSHPQDVPLDTSQIDFIRMGTTVATNALLERAGERCALVITKGFCDLLEIGNQSRPKIFDLEIKRPQLLYEEVAEIDERVRIVTDAHHQLATCDMPEDDDVLAEPMIGVTGERVIVRKRPDPVQVHEQLQSIYDRGIRSLAVVLLHSYAYPHHEKLIGEIATQIGFTNVTLSSSIMAMVKVVQRGYTALADAYLTPCIQQYLKTFASGFDSNLGTPQCPVLFMQSDGGLAAMSSFNGYRAVLSGPAGGYVGYSSTCICGDITDNGQLRRSAQQMASIGFDMGGTSTDCSRYDPRDGVERGIENITAGVPILAPQIDISTVAAGGGSRLFFRSGLFVVGPESAGAFPGPVCCLFTSSPLYVCVLYSDILL